MKILSAEDIRSWDQFTIANEPIKSIDLMERAAEKCVLWMEENGFGDQELIIFCGKGNNGGDGLAIARILKKTNRIAKVFILDLGQKGTDDFNTNLLRLQKTTPASPIKSISTESDFPVISPNELVIDALFGSGLNRGLEDITAHLVKHINEQAKTIIAIDIPSGLFTDRSSAGNIFVKATHTLSFQCYKPAFLFAENEEAVGQVNILDIGLHKDFNPTSPGRFELIDDVLVNSIYKPRKQFSHKGNFGHALLVAGSYGKTGAAILAAKSCLRSGVGLLTCHLPRSSYAIMQTAVPEAMVTADRNEQFNTKIEDDITRYSTIGIGPGLGNASETKMMLREIFDSYRSAVVLDADALNILSTQKDLLEMIPAGSILTPHPKEFERLFGETANEFERVQLAMQKANELDSIIILKGHYTFIAVTDGKGRPDPVAGLGFFNSTGNPGMATAGSGDVLTGILTSFLAQGYSSIEAAILGVYIHGLAGDIAAKQLSMEAMIAGDITEHLGAAFQSIQ